VTAKPGDSPAAEEATAFELDGLRCRLVRVDGRIPLHACVPGSNRPRHRFISNEVAHFSVGKHRYSLLVEDADAAQDDAQGRDPRTLLSNRELQIVQLISMGLLTKQVSDRLRISEFTVRSYLKTIYCKLGVRSRGALVYAYAKSFTTSATERHPERSTASARPGDD
jgi:DNA-binding CsgD family transcriptional regulator